MLQAAACKGSALLTMISLATPYCAYLLGRRYSRFRCPGDGRVRTLPRPARHRRRYSSEARLEGTRCLEHHRLRSEWICLHPDRTSASGSAAEHAPAQLAEDAGGRRRSSRCLLDRAAHGVDGARLAPRPPDTPPRFCGQEHHDLPNRNQLIVLGWSGLRGVLTLAAALSLPETIARLARPFPHRDMILFLAFSVIVVTLVGQGLSLPYRFAEARESAARPDTSTEEERDARVAP